MERSSSSSSYVTVASKPVFAKDLAVWSEHVVPWGHALTLSKWSTDVLCGSTRQNGVRGHSFSYQVPIATMRT